MEYSEDEADASDVIDERGAGGGSSAGPDLGSVLGGMLGGGSGGGGAGGMGGLPGGLGGVLGSVLGGGRRNGGAAGGSGKAGCGGKVGLLLVIVMAAFILPKLLSSSGMDSSNVNVLPPASDGQLPDEGRARDASLPAAADDQLATFANVIITDTNNVWQDLFRSSGKSYERTKMVLFTGGTSSGCGPASSAMGPFYCPADKRVYIDLGFFDELSTRFGAAGDFAQAYVIAHEVGHHVQDELGISDQVHQAEQDDPELARGPESLSVKLELQADCLAGVWAHSRYERGQADPTKRLDDGDIDEALDAASGVGDDSIQKSATGRVNPEGFTHGTSAQRKRWFKTGYDSGNADRCDTFAADRL